MGLFDFYVLILVKVYPSGTGLLGDHIQLCNLKGLVGRAASQAAARIAYIDLCTALLLEEVHHGPYYHRVGVHCVFWA